MEAFTAHRLRFVAEVREPIELNEHQGSAIRGALFHALRNRFCANQEAAECAACPLVVACPVATLVSTLKPESGRGRDVPRPYTIQPPVKNAGRRMENGEWRMEEGGRLEFGLTLYARALQLFPYVVLAVGEFERGGLGRKVEQANGRWRRGTLAIQEAWAENPLTGERQSVLRAGDKMVQVPDVPITHAQVQEWAKGRMEEWRMEGGEWRMENGEWRIEDGRTCSTILHPSFYILHPSSCILHFLTPTRIVERGHLVKPEGFRFQPFFQRLMERLEALSRDFSDTPLRFDDPRGLIEAAGRVRVVENRLVWEELRSYSTRRQAESPTSGFTGSVVLEADDWEPFLTWLAWGQFTHVGKDAVKGNGWVGIEDGGWRMEDGGWRMENGG